MYFQLCQILRKVFQFFYKLGERIKLVKVEKFNFVNSQGNGYFQILRRKWDFFFRDQLGSIYLSFEILIVIGLFLGK